MSMITVPVLSIRQPWIWAIFYAGKRLENRSWWTSYRGPILLHASKTLKKGEFKESALGIYELTGKEPASDDEYLFGGIVGRAKLVNVMTPQMYREGHDDWWVEGNFGWRLADVQQLQDRTGKPVVIPWKGRQGLFEVNVAEWNRERGDTLYTPVENAA